MWAHTEVRSCVKAEAAVLGSPSLMVSVDVLLPVKDWALSERCNSCRDMCIQKVVMVNALDAVKTLNN